VIQEYYFTFVSCYMCQISLSTDTQGDSNYSHSLLEETKDLWPKFLPHTSTIVYVHTPLVLPAVFVLTWDMGFEK
jgi:hypothetical protein